MIKVNGVEFPKFPSTYQVTVSDLDDGSTTTRTMDGILHRDRIAVKQKIELTYNVLTGEELATTLQAIQDVFFEVTYPDPVTNAESTGTFYVGNRTAPVGKRDEDGSLYWVGVAFNFIEQ